MHLVYLDESGNSGGNLKDTSQPIFLLCALIVPESQWLELENALGVTLEQYFPGRPESFEVHTHEIVSPPRNSFFRAYAEDHRLDFLRAWFGVAKRFELRVIHRAIVKKRYARWLETTLGPGVIINPHNVAFLFVSQVVNDYLRETPNAPLGIFISDENHQVMADLEKSIRLLRGESSVLKLSQIIEKGFFIDSRKSLPLQLCDLCAYTLCRMEIEKVGIPIKPIHKKLVSEVKSLIHRGAEPMPDVLAWLESQQKKKRPGN